MPKVIAKITAESLGYVAYLVWSFFAGREILDGHDWLIYAGLLVINFLAGFFIASAIIDDARHLSLIRQWKRASRDGVIRWLGDHDA